MREPNLSSDNFDGLWAQTHERLCRFVCSRLADEQDAEDVLQDVYLRVYDQLETVRDPRRLESWMYQIARHRIIDQYRSRHPWVDLSESLPADTPPDEETGAPLLASLQETVQGLPDPYREALLLADFQGMAQQDLAARLGISLSGAKSRVQRARQQVKAGLLRCFDFEFDARGQVLDYRQHCCC